MKSAKGWTGRAARFAALGLGLGLLFAGRSALAKCGDVPGDFDKVEATRAEMKSQCPCETATSHRAHTSCARNVVRNAIGLGNLPRQCASLVMRCARKSSCGRPPWFVPCCRTSKKGVTKCSIKNGIDRCRPPKGGSACASLFRTDCCDACTNGGCFVPTPTPTSTPWPTSTPITFCDSLVPAPGAIKVPIHQLPGTTNCGGTGLVPPPLAPFSGNVTDATGANLADLGLGCLYLGALPPTRLEGGGTSVLEVVGLGLPTVTLGGSAGSGPLDCTKGTGPLKHCSGGPNDNGLCEIASDCPSGTCIPDANCYFGPPIPVAGDPVLGSPSTCVVNVLASDMCGSLNILTFDVNFHVAISSRIFFGTAAEPCPLCQDGVCSAGKRAGLSCTPVGSAGTSPDCLPTAMLGIMDVVIPNLTTATATVNATPDGLFCEGQPLVGPSAESLTGAFLLATATQVTQQGVGAAQGGTSGETVAVGNFCVYKTHNFALDALGAFPQLGTVATKSSIDISGILGP